jgi:hypothetical protein
VALLVEEETQRIMPARAAVTEARVHFRVNVSAITRMLPRHLRELFKRKVTKRLLARRDEHVSVAPTCCGMRTQ